MRDEDIDFSDIPPVTDEMFARSVALPPRKIREPKEEFTVKLDRDLAKWYRDMGPQYHGLLNLLLRRYMQERVGKRAQPKARRA